MQIAMTEARARLAELVEMAEAGEVIVITRDGRPAAEPRQWHATPGLPLFGAMRGRIEVAEDFDALPRGFVESLGAPVEPE